MIITHKLEMDLAHRGEVRKIDVVQGDCNTRVLELTLLCGGEAWTVPEGVSVWMRYCKSDGTRGVYDTLPDGTSACAGAGNLVTAVLAPQMLTVAGTVLAQVVLAEETAELATFTLQIHVERNPAAGALTSEDYSNMLQWMEEELERLLLQAKESGAFDGSQGPAGQNVFTYAVEAGYTGEEAAFREMLITPCLPLAGGTMAGAVNMGGQALSGLAAPSGLTDAVTKSYVDQKHVRAMVTLGADGWGDTAPYIQSVSVPAMLSSDWPRIEASFTGTVETDRALKSAVDCIDYVVPANRFLKVYCLDSKPDIDIILYVEMIR